MAQELYFVNELTKRRYKVVGKDPETNELVLQGTETGVEFKQKFDQAQFKALGYRLEKKIVQEVQEDDED